MMNSSGAFAAPAVFDILLDRVAADVYPSERFVISAALSARTTEQFDKLLAIVGRQLIGHYLSPRRVQLIGMIAERRELIAPAKQASEKLADPESDEIEIDELKSAVELLAQTRALLD